LLTELKIGLDDRDWNAHTKTPKLRKGHPEILAQISLPGGSKNGAHIRFFARSMPLGTQTSLA
jgi:hypothetical protein